MRQLIAGNWKMNGLKADLAEVEQIRDAVVAAPGGGAGGGGGGAPPPPPPPPPAGGRGRPAATLSNGPETLSILMRPRDR